MDSWATTLVFLGKEPEFYAENTKKGNKIFLVGVVVFFSNNIFFYFVCLFLSVLS